MPPGYLESEEDEFTTLLKTIQYGGKLASKFQSKKLFSSEKIVETKWIFFFIIFCGNSSYKRYSNKFLDLWIDLLLEEDTSLETISSFIQHAIFFRTVVRYWAWRDDEKFWHGQFFETRIKRKIRQWKLGYVHFLD